MISSTRCICCSLLLLLFSYSAFAQLTDDFADGDFTNNPAWTGDTDRFAVTDGELQLLDESGDGGTSYLSVAAPTSSTTVTTWSFYVRLEFAPSGSNFARVYLQSSAADLTGSLTGYFCKIGGATGDVDALELYRQDGTATELLLAGTPGTLADDPATVRVTVTRDTDGNWLLEADYTGGEDLEPVGSVTDTTYPAGDWFGVWCDYTATRAENFFFDDISVDPLFSDTQAPTAVAVTTPTAQTVKLTFDETIDPTSLTFPGTEIIISATAGPDPVITASEVDAQDATMVLLTLAGALQPDQTYTLSYIGITDLAGNAAPLTEVPFTFINIVDPQPGDLVLTEIMADPSPPVALPNVEYIEIYNRSTATVRLGNVFLASGGTPQQLPNELLAPGEYLLVADTDDLDLFAANLRKIGLASFPALSNAGDVVELTDANGTLLTQVNYTEDWYADPARDDGGYSLELIQLDGPNDCAANWRASTALQGGTPAAPNAVAGLTSDTTAPRLQLAYSLDGTSIIVLFDESVDPIAATQVGLYDLDNGATVDNVLPGATDREVRLFISPTLPFGSTYTLTVGTALPDCLGNVPPQAQTTVVERVIRPQPGDLIVTEIMADPAEQLTDTDLPDAEYIELYNATDNALLLQGIGLHTGSSPRLLPDYILRAGEYLVVTATEFAAAFTDFGNVVGLPDFPFLFNSRDEVVLVDGSGSEIFYLEYDRSWYSDPVPALGGVSLELIDLMGPYDCSENWRASQDIRGGTPGIENSVLGMPFGERGPRLLWAFAQSENELIIQFDQDLAAESAETLTNYVLTEGVSPIDAFLLLDKRRVQLLLDQSLAEGQIYTLTVAGDLTNCVSIGNTVDQTFRFGLTVTPEPGDVIINELLYYAESGGSDFIELYNRSDKIINLGELAVYERTGDNGDSILIDYPLLPGDYAVLTEDTADINSRYRVENPGALLQNPLPTLPNDAGSIGIYLPGRVPIDTFAYSTDLHNQLLNSVRGVSLERLDPDAPTNAAGNWHSAAGAVGYATPTYVNSQFFPATDPAPAATIFSLEDATFSPDSDGFQDVLILNYQVDRIGYIATLRIFDVQGRLVRQLNRTDLLGTNGRLLWDGTADDGRVANIGIHLIFIELFTPDGDTRQEKLTAVLAR